MTTKLFTTENTRDYSAAELAALNAEWSAIVEAENLEIGSPEYHERASRFSGEVSRRPFVPTVRERILEARTDTEFNDNSGSADSFAELVCEWSNAQWAEIDDEGDICVGMFPDNGGVRWLSESDLETFLAWLEAQKCD